MILPTYYLIDLSNERLFKYPISKELYQHYLGGKILAAKILTDLTKPNIETLGEESLIIINTGPMNGTGAPSSSRFNVTFKNVLTNGIASSNCGGDFGFMLKRAGIDGLIIKGRAKHLTTIEIVDGQVTLKDATTLRGLDTEKTQSLLPKKYGKLVIGPAGENLVRYACLVSGERVAGRCGAGAVFGSKNIKAIVTYGVSRPVIEDSEKFKKYIQGWTKFIKNHPMTGISLPLYGTAGLVNKANYSCALPTLNFQQGFDPQADNISGETLTEKLLIKNSGCTSCPIRCERRVMVNNKDVKGPEYETIGLFGANIGNDNLELINHFNYHADLLGMDTISLAGTLAMAMEMDQLGISDFGLKFEDTNNIAETIYKIAHREGKYSELANGTNYLAQQYHAQDYAINAKGLELASYEPRRSVGMGLGYATGNRGGCHLNGGYLALLESVGVITMNAQTPIGKPELTMIFQDAMEVTSAAGFCLFTLQTMIPSFLFKTGPNSLINKMVGGALLLARDIIYLVLKTLPYSIPFNSMYLFPQVKAINYATGLKLTSGDYLLIGMRGFNNERLYNLREGLSASDDNLPKRLTNIPQDNHPNTLVPLSKMLPRYYKIRGWDKQGIPTAKTIKRLSL